MTSDHFADAVATIEDYRDALRRGDLARCAQLRDGLWHHKTLSADHTQGERVERFRAQGEEQAIHTLMARYYRAVDEGDGAALASVFDDGWHMKNLEHGAVVCEDKRQFMARVAAGPLPDYSVDRMALVRVDKPATEGVTMFVLLRTSAGWQVTDKAWTAPA